VRSTVALVNLPVALASPALKAQSIIGFAGLLL
jgi:hypothetical protein